MNKRPSIAFIKSGSFSHINAAVEFQLRRNFPDSNVIVLDIRSLIFRNIWGLLEAGMSAWKVNGLTKLLEKRDPIDSIVQSPAMFKRLKRLIEAEVRRLGCSFTFQTQSLWDSACPGVPHFVYTDHTELANLDYPDFDSKKLLGEWWLPMERAIYQNATRVFTMSGHVTDSLVRDYRVSKERVECVRAGSNSDVDALSRINRGKVYPPLILFVGVDWIRKGGTELVSAFERLRGKHPDAKLRIVGCRPSLDVAGCEVLGRVPLGEMARHYADASIFCLPTRVEPFGIAFVEAMHAGLPVIGSDLGAVKDMVRNGVNGYRVAVGDTDGLVNILSKLIEDSNACKEMGIASRKIAQSEYTWDAVGLRIFDSIKVALP